MTLSEIESMPAGREMDYRIAELRGWKWTAFRGMRTLVPPDRATLTEEDIADGATYATGEEPTWLDQHDVPHFSTDIAAAWTLVAQMSGDARHVRSVDVKAEANTMAACQVNRLGGGRIRAYAATAPLAICRAFIKWADGGAA